MVGASEVARRSELLGALLVSIPLVSILAMIWLPHSMVRGSGISIVRQLFYPLFMLFLVQIIFRKDLVR